MDMALFVSFSNDPSKEWTISAPQMAAENDTKGNEMWN